MSDLDQGRAWRRLRAELAVALRYLRSARDDTLIHQLTRLTVAGLALGVAALILALSALTGFQEHLLDDVLSRSPELQVEWRETPAPELLEAIARVDGVESIQGMRRGRGWIRREGGEPRDVEILAYESFVPRWLRRSSTANTPDSLRSGVLVSDALARPWGLEAGEVIELITPRRTLTPLGPAPRTRRLEVVGLLDGSRIHEVIGERVALPLDLGASLLGPGRAISDIGLVEGADEGEVEETLRALLPPSEAVRVTTWREQHRSLLFVLRLEKFAVFASVTLIVLVASFALVSALALILSSKRAELGLLSAVGMSRRRLRRLFLMLGALLAAGGAGLGGLLGASTAFVLDHFEIISLPGDLYVVDHVPFAVRSQELLAVLAATVIVTLVAAFFGARGATSWTPVEALRR